MIHIRFKIICSRECTGLYLALEMRIDRIYALKSNMTLNKNWRKLRWVDMMIVDLNTRHAALISLNTTFALGYLDVNIHENTRIDTLKVPGFTIYGVAGSAAQTYAEENGFVFVEVEPEYTPGDIDESGRVDIADLRMVLRAVCGKTELTSQQQLAADVETDGTVNIADLRKILRFVCGKLEEL